ncbi:hypothetical protein M0802_009748 [Mischocyttarus mexicanus]|nr:hypothetical protein M0802_009748 [Mischocyttarus mexicanus]
MLGTLATNKTKSTIHVHSYNTRYGNQSKCDTSRSIFTIERNYLARFNDLIPNRAVSSLAKSNRDNYIVRFLLYLAKMGFANIYLYKSIKSLEHRIVLKYHCGTSAKSVIYWKQINPDKSTFGDEILIILGAFFQQGYSYEPYQVLSRIITLMLLISALSLYTSNTANIIALLQSTTNSI